MATTLILGHGKLYEGAGHTLCSPIDIKDWPEHYISVDIHPAVLPDIVCDLRIMPWPFADSSFHTVIDTCGLGLFHYYMRTPFAPFFDELRRVLNPCGTFYGRGSFIFKNDIIP